MRRIRGRSWSYFVGSALLIGYGCAGGERFGGAGPDASAGSGGSPSDSDGGELARGGESSNVAGQSSSGSTTGGAFNGGAPNGESGAPEGGESEAGGASGASGGCSPAEQRCSGNGVQVCGLDGAWGDVSACFDGTPNCKGAGVCSDPPSCKGLQKNCGPTNNPSSCCDSPIVPGGTFNRKNDVALPATVSAFRLDKFETTVGRFRKYHAAYSADVFPKAGDGKNPNNPTDPGWNASWNGNLPADASALDDELQCDPKYQTWTGGNDNRPINCVSWFLAYAFCIWDGGRLPTDAEINYAAAGGSEQRGYAWGSTPPGSSAKYSVWGCYSELVTSGVCTGIENINPVGHAPAGNGKWGHSDISGNLAEWLLDWYYAPPKPCVDCANLTPTTARMLSGSSFNVGSSSNIGTTYPESTPPGSPYHTHTVRCARDN